MKILFTGASSLTGLWFVKELSKGGHEVTATFQQKKEAYRDLRKGRVDQVLKYCQPKFECPFGTDSFIQVIEEESNWDLLCHHAAEVTNYKNSDFNVNAAVAKNTFGLTNVLNALTKRGCHQLVLTGSVFEPNEGAGTDQLRAVSPYGLSKGLTSSTFQFYTSMMGIRLGKFVIPNPFGPYEEFRYTSFLIQSWFHGKVPVVNTPDYVRDNIHVSLLAKAYKRFCEKLPLSSGYEKLNPSGYIETQKAFTDRFSKEMQSRLGLECKFDCKNHLEFTEPKVRINTDAVKLDWNEQHAWDELATYYKNVYHSDTPLQGCIVN